MRNIRDYMWAETPTQALQWMATRPGRGAFLGGGTTLAAVQDGELDFVVDLCRAGLDRIENGTDAVLLGATVTLQRLLEEPGMAGIGDGVLCEALRATRTDPWRRQATLAGRLLEREPGDLVTLVLECLGGSIGLLRTGETEPEWVTPGAAVEACLAGRARAGLPASERRSAVPVLVTSIRIPWPQPGWGFALERVTRSALDTPLVAVAAAVHGDVHRIGTARLAISAGGAPQRAPRTEAAARGCAGEDYREVLAALDAEIEPTEDWRASATYRRQVAGVLLARALRGARLVTGGMTAR
jgi:CO/xanthine dehydrogenase FAD-binding subunit